MALDIEAVAAQLDVAGDRPDIRSEVVFLRKNLLGFHGLIQDRA